MMVGKKDPNNNYTAINGAGKMDEKVKAIKEATSNKNISGLRGKRALKKGNKDIDSDSDKDSELAIEELRMISVIKRVKMRERNKKGFGIIDKIA